MPGTVIYVDADTNGSLDLGELSTTAASDGSYHLRLAAGQYTIRQQVPVGQTQTTVDQSTSVLIGSDTTNLDFGSGTLPSAPTGVDLAAIVDTGFSDTDNTTSKNNASVVNALEFVVSGVQDGAIVSVLADGQEIGQAVAVGSEATVITSGSQVLADGSHAITATQSLGVLVSSPTSALTVSVDTAVEDFSSTPPTTATIAEALVYDVQNPEEGDPGFTYSIDNMPEGMAVNAATGIVTWTPVASQLGSQQVVITATDAAGNTHIQPMTVEVSGEVLVNYRLEAIDSLGNVLTEVSVGDDFTLRGLVQDLRTGAEGVFAGYVDAVIENQFVSITGPITFGAEYQNATSGDLSQVGLIDEVGAMSGLSPLGGSEQILFTIPVRADSAGTEVFSTNAADGSPATDTLLFGSNDPVNTAKIAYQSTPLTVNVAFTVEADLFNFDEDSQDVSLDVLLNDIVASGGEALTIIAVGTPSQNGTVSIAPDGKTLTYSPAADFFGAETFSYTAGNTTGSVQGAVVVQVHPLNDDPSAVDDFLTADANSTDVFLDLLLNDSFAPDASEELEIISVGATDQNGQVALGPNGTHVLYTPAAGFNGTESFDYTISDGNSGQAVGTVTVQVGESNDGTGPTANADAVTVAEDSSSQVLDVLANDTLGTDGGSLVISAVGTPGQGGAVQLAGDSLTLVYTPAADFFGDEIVSYTLADGNGGSATGQVTVTVTGSNDDPTANDDALTAIKNAADQVLSPLVNDAITPDEGESLSITAVGTPDQGGTVTIATDGQTVLYTPATDFVAQETFTYTIDDGNGGTSQGTVTVDVLDYVPSKLAGSVYLDSNNDGLQDAEEMVLSGVTLTLEGTDFNSVAVSQTLTTNSQGAYEFADLAPGSYVISQVQPAYLIDGQDSVGSQGGSIPQDNQIAVELTEDTDGINNNFAERGREASTFTLADFFGSARDASVVGSFGQETAEQWVALDATWDGYETTDVTWFENSHTLVIDVTETNADINSAVLSWEAGHAVRSLGSDLDFPMIAMEDAAGAVGFTAGSRLTAAIRVTMDNTGDNTGDRHG